MSARRTVVVTMAALAVAVLLVWSASTGPSTLAEGLPRHPVVTHASARHDHAGEQRPAQQRRHEERNTRVLGTGLQWVDDAVGLVAFLSALWALTALVRLVANLVVNRLSEKQLVVDLEPVPDVAAGRDAVTRDRDRLREALSSPDVRNGIVACWVLLEDDAAEAGVARRPAETPTEFVVRFLHALDVDPRPVALLADLYREARFSTHPMGAEERARAESALAAVHDELAATAAPV